MAGDSGFGRTGGAALGRRALLAGAMASGAMASLAAPAASRAAFGKPRFILKLHHAFSALSCIHADFLAPWVRAVETQTGGRLRIDIYPSMELGGRPADLFDQARTRYADIVLAMPRDTPGRFPGIETFELPFVPSRRALVNSRAVEDFCSQNLKDEFRDIRPLGFFCADRGVVHAGRPIGAVPELRDLRLDVRTRFAAQAVRVLGGRAEIVPSAQLPFAIAGHVVNGGILPWHMVRALKLDRLFRAHTDFERSSLATTAFVLAMNKTAYDLMPADIKKAIDDHSGQAAAGMAGSMFDLKARAVAAMVRQHGGEVVTLPADTVARWRSATALVIHFWLRGMRERGLDGGRLLARAHALLEKYADLPEPQPAKPPKPAPPAAANANPARHAKAQHAKAQHAKAATARQATKQPATPDPAPALRLDTHM